MTSSADHSARDAVATTADVFAHHLGAFAEGIDAILADYGEDSVLIMHDRAFRGRDEIRAFFQAFLDGATPQFWKAFTLLAKCVHGEVAYFTWRSEPTVTLATDTLVVRGGKIAVHTFTSYP